MTAHDVLRGGVRRWYLILLGAVLTLGTFYVVSHRPGVYFTQYELVLLPPPDEMTPNTMEDPHYGMVPMAGLLVTEYNRGTAQLLIGSPDTTLYGEGVTQGSRVRLPNSGSQWVPMYPKPNIDVQVVGPTAEYVAAEAVRIHAEIDSLLKQRQDELRVVNTMRMSLFASPHDPVIAQVGGSRARVLVGVGVVGGTTTTIAVYWLDRWWTRRTRDSAASPDKAAISVSV